MKRENCYGFNYSFIPTLKISLIHKKYFLFEVFLLFLSKIFLQIKGFITKNISFNFQRNY
jgi:hypothetical protein